MNIPEYFMYEAERMDNGEMVRGNILQTTTDKIFIVPSGIEISIFKHKSFLGEKLLEVNPETVHRVAVKPIEEYNDYEKRNTYKCPNCERRIIPESHFCQWKGCGMALKWEGSEMNIPKYYMYEAERMDNGETVRGYPQPFKSHETMNGMRIKNGYGGWHTVKVDPETVRRVKMPVVIGENGNMHCPNCNRIVKGVAVHCIMYYCPDCGMALEWEDDHG